MRLRLRRYALVGRCRSRLFFLRIEHGLIPARCPPSKFSRRYQQYKGRHGRTSSRWRRNGHHPSGHCEKDIRALAAELFRTVIEPRIFPEMRELTYRLADDGCQVWAVLSTNNWSIEAPPRAFASPGARHRPRASRSKSLRHRPPSAGPTDDELEGNPIQELIGCRVDAIFGNSIHDLAMLETTPHPFAVNPNPDLEKIARTRGWTVYQPTSTTHPLKVSF